MISAIGQARHSSVEVIILTIILKGVFYIVRPSLKPSLPLCLLLQMLDLGERLIKAGVLYADDTPVEKMREERMDGIESQRRNRTVEENLAMFKEMQAGSEEGLKNCLRFKLDMQAGNKALRDPVAFRCNLTSHWRTGDKYKVRSRTDGQGPHNYIVFFGGAGGEGTNRRLVLSTT